MTPAERENFEAYFNVADEIYESLERGLDQTQESKGSQPLTLADLDEKYVEQARNVATLVQLPWPPWLPAAEEYALDINRIQQHERKSS